MSAVGKWTLEKMPDQSNRIAVVTGANSGIGYETTKALAARGAHVVMACRSLQRAEGAAAEIRREHSQAKLEIMVLDLADLQSVRDFAAAFNEAYTSLDLLINNAGIMAIPYRETADGFEMQFGVNHLGHFALTGLLLRPLLNDGSAGQQSRVVAVSSGAHQRTEHFDFEGLQSEDGYSPWAAYSRSKLANLLFAYELQRRLHDAGYDVLSVGAHPGYCATNLQQTGPRMKGSGLRALLMRISNRLFAQSAAMGALPILYAATAPEVNGCDYVKPDGLGGMRGHPEKARSSAASYDEETAARLWEISEELTGVQYSLSQG